MASPYSLGAKDDFDLAAHQEAFDKLPDGPEKEAGRPVMKALENGTIHPSELAGLAGQGAPAPSGPNPYGQANQAGPPTQAQAAQGLQGPAPVAPGTPPSTAQSQGKPESAINQELAARLQRQAGQNLAIVNAQQGGPLKSTPAPNVPNLPVISKGSGGYAGTTETAETHNKSSDTHKGIMTGDELDNSGLLQQYNDTPLARSAQSGIDQLQDRYNRMPQGTPGPFKGDLGGFLQMLSKPGRDLAAGYISPQVRQAEQTSAANAILEKIQTAKDAQLTNQAAVLRAGAGGVFGNSSDALQKIQEMMGTKTQDNSGKAFTTANAFNKYSQSELKANDASATSLAEVAAEVAEGNPLSDKRIAVLRAKLDAGGRPNISEVQMEGGDASLMESLRQKLSTALTGNMTDHNRELFMKDIQTVAALKQKERNMYIEKLKNQGATQYGQSPEQLAAAFPQNFSSRFDMPIAAAKATVRKLHQPPPSAPAAGGPAIQSIDDYFKAKGQ